MCLLSEGKSVFGESSTSWSVVAASSNFGVMFFVKILFIVLKCVLLSNNVYFVVFLMYILRNVCLCGVA